MAEPQTEGLVLERKVRGVTVKVAARTGESLNNLLKRLSLACEEIDFFERERDRQVWVEEIKSRVEEAIAEIEQRFNLTDDQLTKTGISNDYQRVLVSLLRKFDMCMGASTVANEWGGINTGSVSRVFRASRKSTEKYRGHFEACKEEGYRFTKVGLDYALKSGVLELLKKESDRSSK